MKKILLTGSDGFVASRFYEYYKDQYAFILANRHTLDITDEAKVYRLFKDEKIDVVVHAAAMADIGDCEKNQEQAFKTNVQATATLAKGCTLQNSIMLFMSSDQIFSGNTEKGPYTEETVPVPANYYAETKWLAEKEIAALTERYYNLRLTWMFSMPERNKRTKGIIPEMLRALMRNKPAHFNENDFRGITYVYEVIENFTRIIELPYGDYNAGNDNTLSVYEVGRVILDALGLQHREADILHPSGGRLCDLRIDNTKIKAFGAPFSTTEQAVRRCIAEFS